MQMELLSELKRGSSTQLVREWGYPVLAFGHLYLSVRLSHDELVSVCRCRNAYDDPGNFQSACEGGRSRRWLRRRRNQSMKMYGCGGASGCRQHRDRDGDTE